jgi:hypothetical protein
MSLAQARLRLERCAEALSEAEGKRVCKVLH